MSIIKTHSVTLRCGNETGRIVLRPLCDAHLPSLYKWCADPLLDKRFARRRTLVNT